MYCITNIKSFFKIKNKTINMEIDLSTIGFEKGKQYETIITTSDSSNKMNAAPIGVICRDPDTIMCRIFKGSHTLSNIILKREFTVNICENPMLFAKSTIGNLDEDEFEKDNSIKNVDCYFKCEVSDLIEAIKRSDPIKNESEAIVIKANVTKLVINNPIKAYNRSFSLVIESLVNFSRIDMVDSETQEYYLNRFREANRVIKKVGSKKDLQSINEIKNKLIEKGYKP